MGLEQVGYSFLSMASSPRVTQFWVCLPPHKAEGRVVRRAEMGTRWGGGEEGVRGNPLP